MKKSLYIAGLLLASSLYGAESTQTENFYVGIGFSNGTGTETNDWTGGLNTDTKVDYDSKAFPLSIGMITSKNDRVELSYTNADVDTNEGTSYDIVGIDLNYDFTLESLRVDQVLPYIGLGIGLYEFKDSGTIYNIQGNEDLQGLALNLNLGLLYNLSKKIEFEAAYQYKNIQWEELESVNSSEKLKVDEEIHSLYVGFNYKF